MTHTHTYIASGSLEEEDEAALGQLGPVKTIEHQVPVLLQQQKEMEEQQGEFGMNKVAHMEKGEERRGTGEEKHIS